MRLSDLINEALIAKTMTPEQDQAVREQLCDPRELLNLLPLICYLPADSPPRYRDRLMTWLGFAAYEYQVFTRHQPKHAKALAQEVEQLFDQVIAEPDCNPEITFATLALLKEHGQPVSKQLRDKLMSRMGDDDSSNKGALVQAHSEDPERLFEEAHQAFDSFNFTSAYDFAAQMSAELGLMPPDATAPILSLTANKSWGLDAAVLMLGHRDADVREQVVLYLTEQPQSRWAELGALQPLRLLRQFADPPLAKLINQWQGFALSARERKAERPSTILECLVSPTDGTDAMMLAVLLKHKGHRHLGTAIYRLGQGLVDSDFIPTINKAQWRSVKQGMQDQTGARCVQPQLMGRLLAWALYELMHVSQGEPGSTGLQIPLLQLVRYLPSDWLAPQPLDLKAEIEASGIDLRPTQLVHYRKCGREFPEIAIIASWAPAELPAGVSTVKQVVKRVLLPQRELLAHRLFLLGMLFDHSLDSKKTPDRRAVTCLGCAYSLLTEDLQRKPFDLLDSLAAYTLEEAAMNELDDFPQPFDAANDELLSIDPAQFGLDPEALAKMDPEQLDQALQHVAEQLFAEHGFDAALPPADLRGLTAHQLEQLRAHPFTSPDLVEYCPQAFGNLDQPEAAPLLYLCLALGRATQAAQDSGKGIKLTAKGNLPRQLCRDLYADYYQRYLAADNRTPSAEPQTINTESDFFELDLLHYVMKKLRWLRKAKGHLLPTKALLTLLAQYDHGKTAAARSTALTTLYDQLLRDYALKLCWSTYDADDQFLFLQRYFAFSLYLLHQDGKRFRDAEHYAEAVIGAFPGAMAQIESPAKIMPAERQIAMQHQRWLWEEFAWYFGLAEKRRAGAPDQWPKVLQIRASKLFRRVFCFHV